MALSEQHTETQGPEVGRPGPIPKERFIVTFAKRAVTLLLSAALVVASACPAYVQQVDPSTGPMPAVAALASAQELQQLVAPIALYPDELAAQILAASTYPNEVVEADRWVQQHPDLKGQALADEADKQPWDASVKALVPFPSVLANMDKNLSWTSSLGDAYVNQQQAVMDAIQVMRQRAQQTGSLKDTPQQTVTTQGQTIIVEPADPEVVYVPEYDPWLVYGTPLVAWPGWYPVPGIFYPGPAVGFGLGFGVGFFGGFGWGWHHWGFDWRHHDITFDHDRYVSHSRIFARRDGFDHGHADFHRGSGFRPAGADRTPATRGFSAPQQGFAGQHGFGDHGQTGIHSGAFSGFNHGGVARGFSARGHSSFGGGGFHGGGGHAGGHR